MGFDCLFRGTSENSTNSEKVPCFKKNQEAKKEGIFLEFKTFLVISEILGKISKFTTTCHVPEVSGTFSTIFYNFVTLNRGLFCSVPNFPKLKQETISGPFDLVQSLSNI